MTCVMVCGEFTSGTIQYCDVTFQHFRLKFIHCDYGVSLCVYVPVHVSVNVFWHLCVHMLMSMLCVCVRVYVMKGDKRALYLKK